MTDKTWLIDHIRTTRADFDACVHQLPVEKLNQPAAPGGMTTKEVIYHIAWHDRQMTGMLRTRALAGSPWWDLPTDQRNANIQAEAAPLPVQQVLDYADAAIAELLAALQDLPAEALDNPSFFAGMPEDWSPADILAQNTYEHYLDHIEDMK
jgi:hypothetical protein